MFQDILVLAGIGAALLGVAAAVLAHGNGVALLVLAMPILAVAATLFGAASRQTEEGRLWAAARTVGWASLSVVVLFLLLPGMCFLGFGGTLIEWDGPSGGSNFGHGLGLMLLLIGICLTAVAVWQLWMLHKRGKGDE